MEQKDTREKKLRHLYDAACKELLSYKPVLAFIMKHCIQDFYDCEIGDIVNYYIEHVQVSEVGVHPEESSSTEEAVHVEHKISILNAEGNKILGLNTEDTSMTEGKIYYDIRFFATTPKKESVRLIINIEAQTTEALPYPLLMRAVYYGCRLISSQKEVEFVNSHYEQIKKVYSIWICTNPPKVKEGSVNRYQLTEYQDYGEIVEEKHHYDLMEVIMIRLSNSDILTSNSELLTFLSTLFSPKVSSMEKVKELTKELHISTSKEIERKVDEMCNLSAGVYNLGREEGIQTGREDGIKEKAKEVVFNMLSEAMTDEMILKFVKITKSQLEAWKLEFNSNH